MSHKIPHIFIFLTFLMFFLSGCISSQKATIEESTHEFVINCPSLNKDEIYELTQKWLANTFRSAKAVVEYSNKQTGSLIGNGVIDSPGASMKTQLHFTMNIDIRDEKARVKFINLKQSIFAHNGQYVEGCWDLEYREIQLKIHEKFSSIVDDLFKFITTKDNF